MAVKSDQQGVAAFAVPLYRLLLLLGFLVVWEIVGRQNPILFSYPTQVIGTFSPLWSEDSLLQNVVISLGSLVRGWALAAGIGIVLGVFIGRYPPVALMFEPFLNGLYATPRIALVPLMVLWFGLTTKAILATVFLMTVFPVLIMTAAGVRNAGRDFTEVAKSFCMPEWQVLGKVIFPAALPYIGAGLRLGAGRAVTGMITGEMFIASAGIGKLLWLSQLALRINEVFALLVILAVIAVLSNNLVRQLERRLQSWQPDELETA